MKKITLCVTSVGGGVGQSIIKALSGSAYRVIGLDTDPLAAGLYAVKQSRLIPAAKESNYIPMLLKLCEREACQVLFPGSDTELAKLAQHADAFARIGTTVAVSQPEVIEVADDKLKTFQLLSKNGIAVPSTFSVDTFLKNPNLLAFPCIVKPKVGGSRSQHMAKIKSLSELQDFLSKTSDPSNFVIQEYIEGDEYTCGTVSFEDHCYGVIVMRRILRDGDTYKCFVEHNTVIEAAVRQTVELLKPFGACNVQLRLRHNTPYIFEINARCSGTTAARARAGFNEPLMIAQYLVHHQTPKFRIKPLSILRYWNELVVKNSTIEKLRAEKALTQTDYKQL